MRLNIIAPNLSHISTSHWNNRLKSLNIDLDVIYGYPENKTDPVVLTDTAFYDMDQSYNNAYVWIIESPLILEYFSSGFFERIYNNKDRFVKVFTHDRGLIESSNKIVAELLCDVI